MPVHAYVKQHLFKSAPPSHLNQPNRSLTSTIQPPTRSSHGYSSFNRLPLEIYVEIFGHCPSKFPRIDAQVPPLTLALVCKTWYRLAMKTPRLWSCFELVLEGRGSSQHEKDEIKRRLSLWLHRSRQHPLSFRIIHDCTGVTLDLRSAELLKLLLPHASRWQHVYFHGPGTGLTPLQDQRIGESLRALKSISLQLASPWSHHFDVSRLDIPWSQLSALDLRFSQENVYSLTECYKILSTAQNLSSCTLNAHCSLSLSQCAEKLVLPSLKSLKLVVQGIDPAGVAETSLLDFLERLSFTDLQAFRLEWLVNPIQDGTSSRWQAAHSRLTSFIHSSASSLEHLGLAYLPLRDHEIIKCLDGLPRLRCLDLKYSLTSQRSGPITDVLLQHLTPTNSLSACQRNHRKTNACLPILRTLKLQCSGEYLNQSLLLALVESRAVQGLKEFEVFTLKCLSKEVRDRIGTWKGRGLDFTASKLSVR